MARPVLNLVVDNGPAVPAELVREWQEDAELVLMRGRPRPRKATIIDNMIGMAAYGLYAWIAWNLLRPLANLVGWMILV